MPSTAAEQYLLELINDVRLNPLLAASRIITSYDPFITTDPDLQAVVDASGISGATIRAALQAATPAQPLAFSDTLAKVADGHNAAMIAAGTATDQTASEAPLSARVAAAGYDFQQIAEIVRLGTPVIGGVVSPKTSDQQTLGDNRLREVGIGVADLDAMTPDTDEAISEVYGSEGTSSSFIFGVAYNDANHNGFYSIGEGVAGLNVSIDSSQVTTGDSGGYTLSTSLTGEQQVTLTGGGLSAAVGVTMPLTDGAGNGVNAKLDVINGNTLHINTSAVVTGAVDTVVALGMQPLTIALGDGIGRSIVANSGGDTLTGGSGDDVITGGAGNDTVDGGTGNNILTGGGGDDTVLFDFNSFDASIRMTGAGWVVSEGGTTDTVSGFDRYQFLDRTVDTLAGLHPQAPSDFTVDRGSDLLVETDQGEMQILGTNGVTVTSNASLGSVDPSWHIMASADFDGDGQPDILMQNDNGAMVEYLMEGTSIKAGYSFGNAGSSWHVRGAADFTGDGRADILVENDNGALVTFQTDGTRLTAGIYLGQSPDNGIDVEGIGDFDGDGKSDMLVQRADGALVILNVDKDGITGANQIGVPGAGYSVAGVGDYNGDGTPDIVLHSITGNDVVWEISQGSVSMAVPIGNLGPNYSTIVVGHDFNGDDNADVISQSNDGTMLAHMFDGNATITGTSVLEQSGGGWRLTGSNPIVFQDGSGANLNLSATPGQDAFVFKSFADGLHTISGFSSSKDSIVLDKTAFPDYASVQAHEVAYQGGTFIGLSSTAALLIQGVTPDQLSAGNFTLR